LPVGLSAEEQVERVAEAGGVEAGASPVYDAQAQARGDPGGAAARLAVLLVGQRARRPIPGPSRGDVRQEPGVGRVDYRGVVPAGGGEVRGAVFAEEGDALMWRDLEGRDRHELPRARLLDLDDVRRRR
jgi:hypothetical protein